MSNAQTQGPQKEWNWGSSGRGNVRCRVLRHHDQREDGLDYVQKDDGVFGTPEGHRRDIDRLVQITIIDMLAMIMVQGNARILIDNRTMVVIASRCELRGNAVRMRRLARNCLAARRQQHQRPRNEPDARKTVYPAGAGNIPTKASHTRTLGGHCRCRAHEAKPMSPAQYMTNK